jgi:hypothetical protein
MFAVGGKGFQPNIYVYSYPEQQVRKLTGSTITTPVTNKQSAHSRDYMCSMQITGTVARVFTRPINYTQSSITVY